MYLYLPDRPQPEPIFTATFVCHVWIMQVSNCHGQTEQCARKKIGHHPEAAPSSTVVSLVTQTLIFLHQLPIQPNVRGLAVLKEGIKLCVRAWGGLFTQVQEVFHGILVGTGDNITCSGGGGCCPSSDLTGEKWLCWYRPRTKRRTAASIDTECCCTGIDWNGTQ